MTGRRQPSLSMVLHQPARFGAALLLMAATAGSAQTPVADSPREIVPGVTHRRLALPEGPWTVHIVTVDLRRDGVRLAAARPRPHGHGRATTTAMAKAHDTACVAVVAALNGDFFDLRTGEVENNLLIERTLVKGVPVTESPHDTFDNVHHQFAVTTDGRPLIERFTVDAHWLSRWGPVALTAVNGRAHDDGLVLYTSAFGDSIPADAPGRERLALPLRRLRTRGDTITYAPVGVVRSGAAAIPRNGAVIVGHGASAASVRAMATAASRAPVRVVLSLAPDRGALRTVIGGWPRLLAGGVQVAAAADSLEGTFPRFSSARHPRSGIGFSRDSTTLYLVTVDGRSDASVGMSLEEFARLMHSLGAHDALNLDGGGSTTLVVEHRIVNTPSDPSGERPVGNALLVTRRTDRCGL